MYPREGLSNAFLESADRLAVEVDGQSLTYADLDAMSARLAGWWRAHHESRFVPVICSNSVESVVAHVAALRAGKVLVALDPREPAKRLETVLDDLGLQSLFTDGNWMVEIEASIVSLRQLIDDGPPDNEWYDWDLDEVAWVYFTSGSTGEPKGVLAPYRRRSLGNFMAGLVDPGDRVAITRTLAFTAGSNSVVMSLVHGASLHLLDLSNLSPEELIRHCTLNQITHLTIGPSHFRGIDTSDGLISVESVRMISLSGEKCRSSDFRKLWRVFPNATLLNSYGTTELGTIAYHLIPPYSNIDAETVPVGKPYNCEVFVLDESFKPLSNGEVGQIAVASARRGPGYLLAGKNVSLNQVELHPGEHVVLTGDAGFVDEDGLLRVVGRIDDIVKVNGQIADMSAIQSALSRHERVLNAAVVPFEGKKGRKKLAAVVVARQGVDLSQREIRRHLASELPPWMVPSRIVFTDSIPLGDRGKTDRRRLLALASTGSGVQQVHPEMGDPVIWRIASILSEFVDLDGFGPKDNLQDCGIDSLDAVELVQRLNDEFGVIVPLSQIAREWSLSTMRMWIIDRSAQSRERIVTALVGQHPTELYWLMPGTNVITGMGLANFLRGHTSKFIVGRGAETRDTPNLEIDHVATELVEQFVRQMNMEEFALIGFSSAAWIVQHMAVIMSRLGISPRLLVLLDPPLGDMTVENTAPPEPQTLMLAREGGLLTATPHEADNRILNLQTFGLRHHVKQVFEGKTLVFSAAESPQSIETISSILPNAEVVTVRAEHLELMRDPSICGPRLKDALAYMEAVTPNFFR